MIGWDGHQFDTLGQLGQVRRLDGQRHYRPGGRGAGRWQRQDSGLKANTRRKEVIYLISLSLSCPRCPRSVPGLVPGLSLPPFWQKFLLRQSLRKPNGKLVPGPRPLCAFARLFFNPRSCFSRANCQAAQPPPPQSKQAQAPASRSARCCRSTAGPVRHLDGRRHHRPGEHVAGRPPQARCIDRHAAAAGEGIKQRSSNRPAHPLAESRDLRARWARPPGGTRKFLTAAQGEAARTAGQWPRQAAPGAADRRPDQARPRRVGEPPRRPPPPQAR